MAKPAPVPVTVVGGYLGAGKTTLVNHLLRHADGRRILVLVNDFGELPIDVDLIDARDGDVLTLANGCACCQVGSDLLGALGAALRMQPPPDHLLIEASGVADPARLADLARADPALCLDAVLVVVDAGNIRRQIADRWVGGTARSQLGAAGLILLNKVDRVEPGDIDAIAEEVGRLAPRAVVIRTERAALDVGLAFGPTASPTRSLANPHHETVFASWSAILPEGWPATRMREWLESLPDWVYRAKGHSIDPETGRGFVFHKVGGQIELAPLREASDGTAIVAIGPRPLFRADQLERTLAARSVPIS